MFKIKTTHFSRLTTIVILLIFLSTCKSANQQSTLAESLSNDSPVPVEGGQGFIDLQFDQNCKKLFSAATESSSCQSEYLKAVCAQNLQTIDKAIYNLLAKPETSAAFREVSLRSNLAKFIDDTFRRDGHDCFKTLEKTIPKRTKLSQSKVKDIENSFREKLSNDFATAISQYPQIDKDLFEPMLESIAYDTCQRGVELVNTFMSVHKHNLEVTHCGEQARSQGTINVFRNDIMTMCREHYPSFFQLV